MLPANTLSNADIPVARTLLGALFGLFLHGAFAEPVLPPTPGLRDTGRRSDGHPAIIGHRGACGLRPEHTMASYRLALAQGADFIEPDLHLSKDGVLVCMHDWTLNRTTDIADRQDYVQRARPGENGPTWWLSDFTLQELQTLRCRQGRAGRETQFDNQETIPTFAETVQLVRDHNRQHNTHVGLAPELKHPVEHQERGMDIAKRFLEASSALNLEAPHAPPISVQCFDLATLRRLRPQTKLPLAWLSSKRPASLEGLSGVVQVLSVGKAQVTGPDAAAWIAEVHGMGLGVHAWTFRDDAVGQGFTSITEEFQAAFTHGLDACFTDFPASGVAARDQHIHNLHGDPEIRE